MKFYIRNPGSTSFFGPHTLDEILGELKAGTFAVDCEVVEATGQTSGALKRSPDWVPVSSVCSPEELGDSRASSVASPRSLSTVNKQASKPVLICAFGILAGFFMPWVQLFGVGMSGYNLGQLGSYGNYAWAIPILAGATILLSFSGVNNRAVGALTGIVPLGALLYALVRLSAEGGVDATQGGLKFAQQIFSIGIYVTIIFSIAIIVAAIRPAIGAASDVKPEAKL